MVMGKDSQQCRDEEVECWLTGTSERMENGVA